MRFGTLAFAAVAVALSACAARPRPGVTSGTTRAPEARPVRDAASAEAIPRVSAADALRRAARTGALLVCSYPDEEQCRGLGIPGAIPLAELQRRIPKLPLRTEILLFCA